MPISTEQWRASVGSNNAAKARVFSKIMKYSSHKCSSGSWSFLGQFLKYILALFTSLKKSATDKGKMCMYMCIPMHVHT